MPYHYKPVVLVILDGWGVAPDSEGNAITRAQTPNFIKLLKNYPTMTLLASGTEVGLSFGEMGNSEVGHLNIGAGRVYYQTLPRIGQDIASGVFFENSAFKQAAEQIKKNGSNLHLLGAVSNGNVHASLDHLYALLEFCKKQKLSKEVFVHIILDGRDSLYNSGKVFVGELLKKMKELKVGQIASISGRYYAMDRDNRWDRCEKAYRAIAEGKAERAGEDPLKLIEESYVAKNYDEEFIPSVITKKGQPLVTIKANDAVIFFNFRPDRARELTKAFVLPGFDKFERAYLKNLFFVTLSEYEKELPVVVAYPPVVIRNSLAETISKAGLKQAHLAETEKFDHVSFFLNGTINHPFPGEHRILVPTPKVPSYDQKPEMSASEITKEATKALDGGKYDFMVINFANADMVGHTGDLAATKKGVEVIDKCLGVVVDHALAHGGAVVVTADHGNAEEAINLQTGEIDKEHSNNAVPLIIVSKDFMGQAGTSGDAPEGDLSLLQPVGMLSDVAPTVLSLMGLEQPEEMTGRPLI